MVDNENAYTPTDSPGLRVTRHVRRPRLATAVANEGVVGTSAISAAW